MRDGNKIGQKWRDEVDMQRRLRDASILHEKAGILSRYPHAVAREMDDLLSCCRWVVDGGHGSMFTMGCGPTEAEAWHNAWVHISMAERGKAKLGESIT